MNKSKEPRTEMKQREKEHPILQHRKIGRKVSTSYFEFELNKILTSSLTIFLVL